MTAIEVHPMRGDTYRHRETDKTFHVRWSRPPGPRYSHGFVWLVGESGDWWGTEEDFWETFIHEGANHAD